MVKKEKQSRQRLSTEDKCYQGSTFEEVREAILENPYIPDWVSNHAMPLPVYRVTLRSLLAGVFSRRNRFLNASIRTTRSKADLRWGPDLRGQRRLLHPNGICLTGRWRISDDSDNSYTGYFAPGKEGRVIARYSTCCSETRRNRNRSLSMVGKIYPAETDGNKVIPASFVTQEDLGGTRTSFINDAVLTNAPTTTIWRRGWGIPVFFWTGLTLARADRKIDQRQLYSIAELGEDEDRQTSCPKFMELKVQASQDRIPNHEDFRNEIMAHIYGNNSATNTLKFDIRVADKENPYARIPLQKRVREGDWRKIGEIEFDEAVISYNGDFVIHFHHPPWREDRNDRATQLIDD